MIGTFSNIANLTEWGWRYLELSNILFIGYYMACLSNKGIYNKIISSFKWISPLFLYFIAFQIRGFLCIIGPCQFFAGNYISTWFLNDTTSMWSLMMGR